jgi:hypothetical protein
MYSIGDKLLVTPWTEDTENRQYRKPFVGTVTGIVAERLPYGTHHKPSEYSIAVSYRIDVDKKFRLDDIVDRNCRTHGLNALVCKRSTPPKGLDKVWYGPGPLILEMDEPPHEGLIALHTEDPFGLERPTDTFKAYDTPPKDLVYLCRVTVRRK